MANLSSAASLKHFRLDSLWTLIGDGYDPFIFYFSTKHATSRVLHPTKVNKRGVRVGWVVGTILFSVRCVNMIRHHELKKYVL